MAKHRFILDAGIEEDNSLEAAQTLINSSFPGIEGYGVEEVAEAFAITVQDVCNEAISNPTAFLQKNGQIFRHLLTKKIGCR